MSSRYVHCTCFGHAWRDRLNNRGALDSMSSRSHQLRVPNCNVEAQTRVMVYVLWERGCKMIQRVIDFQCFLALPHTEQSGSWSTRGSLHQYVVSSQPWRALFCFVGYISVLCTTGSDPALQSLSDQVPMKGEKGPSSDHNDMGVTVGGASEGPVGKSRGPLCLRWLARVGLELWTAQTPAQPQPRQSHQVRIFPHLAPKGCL